MKRICRSMNTSEEAMKRPRQFTQHPLHLLDDILASLSPVMEVQSDHVQGDSDEAAPKNDHVAADAALAMAGAKQDVVLRAAHDLFGNNIPLLENALALLEEQEQYQANHRIEVTNSNDPTATPMTAIAPVIRRIRAKRSGREVILVRKNPKTSASERKKSSSQLNPNENGKDGKKNKKKLNTMDDYYLCLLGRDRLDRRSQFTNHHQGWSRIHRQGAHCTCVSFSQKIKGVGGWKSSSAKNSEASISTPCTNNDVVVCKHLLAATLMPHLLPWSKTSGTECEIVDDREFAKLVVRASIG